MTKNHITIYGMLSFIGCFFQELYSDFGFSNYANICKLYNMVDSPQRMTINRKTKNYNSVVPFLFTIMLLYIQQLIQDEWTEHNRTHK